MMTNPSSRMVHSSISMPAPFASTMLRVTTAVQRKSVTPTWWVTKMMAQYMKNLQRKLANKCRTCQDDGPIHEEPANKIGQEMKDLQG